MTSFRKKFPFSRPKFLMTFFSHRPGFSDFPFLSQIFRIFTMLNVVYDPFLTRKTTISEKNSFVTPFFHSARTRTFARIRQHYFSKYCGDGCMGGPFHLKFWGTVPPVPPRSPTLPSAYRCKNVDPKNKKTYKTRFLIKIKKRERRLMKKRCLQIHEIIQTKI